MVRSDWMWILDFEPCASRARDDRKRPAFKVVALSNINPINNPCWQPGSHEMVRPLAVGFRRSPVQCTRELSRIPMLVLQSRCNEDLLAFFQDRFQIR
jgi:hypothetical protein